MFKNSLLIFLSILVFAQAHPASSAVVPITETIFTAPANNSKHSTYSVTGCGDYYVEAATKVEAAALCQSKYSDLNPAGAVFSVVSCGMGDAWRCDCPHNYSEDCSGSTGSGRSCLGKYVACAGDEGCGKNDRLSVNGRDGTQSSVPWRQCELNGSPYDSYTCNSRYKYYAGDSSETNIDARRFYSETMAESSYGFICQSETYKEDGNEKTYAVHPAGFKACPWDAQTALDASTGLSHTVNENFYKYEYCLPDCKDVLRQDALTDSGEVDEAKLAALQGEYPSVVNASESGMAAVSCPYGQNETKCMSKSGSALRIISFCSCAADDNGPIYKKCTASQTPKGYKCYYNHNGTDNVYNQFCLDSCDSKRDDTVPGGNIHPDNEACQDNIENQASAENKIYMASAQTSHIETLAFADVPTGICIKKTSARIPLIWGDYATTAYCDGKEIWPKCKSEGKKSPYEKGGFECTLSDGVRYHLWSKDGGQTCSLAGGDLHNKTLDYTASGYVQQPCSANYNKEIRCCSITPFESEDINDNHWRFCSPAYTWEGTLCTQKMAPSNGHFCATEDGYYVGSCDEAKGAKKCCEFASEFIDYEGEETCYDSWEEDPDNVGTGKCIEKAQPPFETGYYCADANGKWLNSCYTKDGVAVSYDTAGATKSAAKCCYFQENNYTSIQCSNNWKATSKEILNQCQDANNEDLSVLTPKSGQFCFNSANAQDKYVVADCNIASDFQACQSIIYGLCKLDIWGQRQCKVTIKSGDSEISKSYEVSLSKDSSLCQLNDKDNFTTLDGICQVAGYYETDCPANTTDSPLTVCCHVIDGRFQTGPYSYNLPSGDSGRLCSRSYTKAEGSSCKIQYIHKEGEFCARKVSEENGMLIGEYPVKYDESKITVPTYSCTDIPEDERLCCKFNADADSSSSCSTFIGNADTRDGKGSCSVIRTEAVPESGFYCVENGFVASNCKFDGTYKLNANQRCCYVEKGSTTPLEGSCQKRAQEVGNSIEIANTQKKCYPAFYQNEFDYYIFDENDEIVDELDGNEGRYAYTITDKGQKNPESKRQYGLVWQSYQSGYYRSYSANDNFYCNKASQRGTPTPCKTTDPCCQFSPLGDNCLEAGSFEIDSPAIGQCKSSKNWRADTYCANKDTHRMSETCTGDRITCCAFDKWLGTAKTKTSVENGVTVETYDCDDSFLPLSTSPKCIQSKDMDSACWDETNSKINKVCSCPTKQIICDALGNCKEIDGYKTSNECQDGESGIGHVCYYDQENKYQYCGIPCSSDSQESPLCEQTFQSVSVKVSETPKPEDIEIKSFVRHPVACGIAGASSTRYMCQCPVEFKTKEQGCTFCEVGEELIAVGETCNDKAGEWISESYKCDGRKVYSSESVCQQVDGASSHLCLYSDLSGPRAAAWYCKCPEGYRKLFPGEIGANPCTLESDNEEDWVYSELDIASDCSAVSLESDEALSDRPCKGIELNNQRTCIVRGASLAENKTKYICTYEACSGITADTQQKCQEHFGPLAASYECLNNNEKEIKYACGCKTKKEDHWDGQVVQDCYAQSMVPESVEEYCKLDSGKLLYASCIYRPCSNGALLSDNEEGCKDIAGTASVPVVCSLHGEKKYECQCDTSVYKTECIYPLAVPNGNPPYCLKNETKLYQFCERAPLEACGPDTTRTAEECVNRLGEGAEPHLCVDPQGNERYNCMCKPGREYIYDEENCPIRMILTGKQCGGKYTGCECHPSYIYTSGSTVAGDDCPAGKGKCQQCTDGVVSGGSCRPFNADGTRSNTAYYAFCSCPEEYNQLCDGERFRGVGTPCQGKYRSCECAPDPLPENWTDYYYGCPSGLKPTGIVKDNGCGGRYYQCKESDCDWQHVKQCLGDFQEGVNGCQDNQGNVVNYKSCKCPDGWVKCSGDLIGVGKPCSLDGDNYYQSCVSKNECRNGEAEVCNDPLQVGVNMCTRNGQAYFEKCTCASGYNKICKDKEVGVGSACVLNGVSYYQSCTVPAASCTDKHREACADNQEKYAPCLTAEGNVNYKCRCPSNYSSCSSTSPAEDATSCYDSEKGTLYSKCVGNADCSEDEENIFKTCNAQQVGKGRSCTSADGSIKYAECQDTSDCKSNGYKYTCSGYNADALGTDWCIDSMGNKLFKECRCPVSYLQCPANTEKETACTPLNADGSSGRTVYASCTCESAYRETCDGNGQIPDSADDYCESQDSSGTKKSFYKGCKCLSEFNKTCDTTPSDSKAVCEQITYNGVNKVVTPKYSSCSCGETFKYKCDGTDPGDTAENAAKYSLGNGCTTSIDGKEVTLYEKCSCSSKYTVTCSDNIQPGADFCSENGNGTKKYTNGSCPCVDNGQCTYPYSLAEVENNCEFADNWVSCTKNCTYQSLYKCAIGKDMLNQYPYTEDNCKEPYELSGSKVFSVKNGSMNVTRYSACNCPAAYDKTESSCKNMRNDTTELKEGTLRCYRRSSTPNEEGNYTFYGDSCGPLLVQDTADICEDKKTKENKGKYCKVDAMSYSEDKCPGQAALVGAVNGEYKYITCL